MTTMTTMTTTTTPSTSAGIASGGAPSGLDAPLSAEELEALRRAPYPDPAAADRGEVLAATGAVIGVVGVGVVGVGVVVGAALCPACMRGLAPLCAVTAPLLVGAGAWKRWRTRQCAATTNAGASDR
jgi:hypothetical protein